MLLNSKGIIMEYKFNVMSEEEILNLDAEKLDSHLKELQGVQSELTKMSYAIAGKALIDVIYGYKIESIGIDPNYEYNDEGFSGTYMINIDHEDVSYNDENVPRYSKSVPEISYSDLQTKIDDTLADLKFLIADYMSFDEVELKKLSVKSSKYKMEKEIPVKEKSKSSSSRYKI